MRWIVATTLLISCTGGDDEKPPPVNPNVRFTEPLHTIDITVTTGDVAVRSSAGSDVLVEFVPAESGDDWQNSVVDGKLIMGAICGDGSAGCGGGFVIEVPPNTDLVIDATDGAIELRGLAGDIEAVTSSGTVLAEAMGAADLITRTVDAGSQLTFDTPPRHLDVLGGGGGSISVTVPPGSYQVEIDTLGDISISGGVVDGDVGPELVLESGNGNVTVAGS